VLKKEKRMKEPAQVLAEGVNKLYEPDNTTGGLVTLVKRQAEEIDRRGQIVMRLEETVRLQKENLEKLLIQNKHLESMIETMRNEREKLLEEVRAAQENQVVQEIPVKQVRARRVKEKVEVEDATEAA
jgi:hypothetical protein